MPPSPKFARVYHLVATLQQMANSIFWKSSSQVQFAAALRAQRLPVVPWLTLLADSPMPATECFGREPFVAIHGRKTTLTAGSISFTAGWHPGHLELAWRCRRRSHPASVQPPDLAAEPVLRGPVECVRDRWNHGQQSGRSVLGAAGAELFGRYFIAVGWAVFLQSHTEQHRWV